MSEVISKQQYQVLNACADDWELFYFLFATVNSGEQALGPGSEESGSPHELVRTGPVSVPATEITKDVTVLFKAGLLACRHVGADGTRKPMVDLHADEFAVYQAYGCRSFDEHIQRHGYGPHEFKVSDLGQREILEDRYRRYDRELGWS